MNRTLLAAALWLASTAGAQEISLTPGWPTRAAILFTGISPAASSWRNLGDAGAAFDFQKPASQALAFALQARGLDASAYGALAPRERLAAIARAKDDIRHSVFELAALTADKDLAQDRLGVVRSDLAALSGRLRPLLDDSSLRMARVGHAAAQASLEGHAMDLAKQIAERLAPQERADRLAAHPASTPPSLIFPNRFQWKKPRTDQEVMDRISAVHEATRQPLTFLDNVPKRQKTYGSPWIKAASIASALAALGNWGFAIHCDYSMPTMVCVGFCFAIMAAILYAVYAHQDAGNPRHKKWSPREDVK